MDQDGVAPEDVFVHPHGLCESESVAAGTRVARVTAPASLLSLFPKRPHLLSYVRKPNDLVHHVYRPVPEV